MISSQPFTTARSGESSGERVRPDPSPQSGRLRPSLRVLLVDDHADAAASLSLLLGFWGHEVRVSSPGPAAVDLARAFRPDVVFWETGPWGGHTLRVGDLFRDASPGQRPLLIALTTQGWEADRRRSREAGFDFHLVKPAVPEELEELLGVAKSRLG